jgi:hypothetical protein
MQRILLPRFGPAGELNAAEVLDVSGAVVATVAEPLQPPEQELLRDEVVLRVLDEEFGGRALAGVVFAAQWGGDAIGFT